MSLAYLILGGNQGNRVEIFSKAIDLITSKIGLKLAISAMYESESWGFKSELFINQAVIIETILSPSEVLSGTQQIETLLGRVRKTDGYEARTIDIDLLYFDSLVIREADLQIPHPKIAERRFVLVPLAEIAPDLRDSVTGITVLEMLAECADASKVWKLADSKSL
ncbi:MAG: 2-amino-4-hydroxy-6-hydroxymethyldihydropteridine diphosphokinase [Prolixibacteraceae bacterium]